MLHPKDTVTLDRPFAASSGDENLLDVYKITIDDAVLNNADVDWANNYRHYAKAVQLIDDGAGSDSNVDGLWRRIISPQGGLRGRRQQHLDHVRRRRADRGRP